MEQKVRDGCRRALAAEGMGNFAVFLAEVSDDSNPVPPGVPKEEFLTVARQELNRYWTRILNPFGLS